MSWAQDKGFAEHSFMARSPSTTPAVAGVAPVIKAAMGGGLLLAALQAQPAKALVVSVGGSNYNIGFAEGCFTINFANPITNSPGCGTDGTTTYLTPDLYDGGTGILTLQPWWGNQALAFAFTQAYITAAAAIVNASGFTGNVCDYYPIQDGNLDCTDTPYFAYQQALGGPPYYLGYGDFNTGTPNSVYLRQSGFFAVVQAQPAPAPLPILGAAAAFGVSRRLRRRILSVRS